MTLGVGIDIIEVARIQQAHERFGDRFLQRILLPAEIEYCLSYRRPTPFLAARFAAKEAISKAFGTGIGQHLGWHDMEVAHKESGQPYVLLHGNGLSLLQSRRASQLLLSISHTETYAAVVALLEG